MLNNVKNNQFNIGSTLSHLSLLSGTIPPGWLMKQSHWNNSLWEIKWHDCIDVHKSVFLSVVTLQNFKDTVTASVRVRIWIIILCIGRFLTGIASLEEIRQFIKNEIKIQGKNYCCNKAKDPSSLGGSIWILWHRYYRNDEEDDGGTDTAQEVHEGPVKAFKSLIELCGICKEQKKSGQEFKEGSCDKSSCCWSSKADKADERRYHFTDQK